MTGQNGSIQNDYGQNGSIQNDCGQNDMVPIPCQTLNKVGRGIRPD